MADEVLKRLLRKRERFQNVGKEMGFLPKLTGVGVDDVTMSFLERSGKVRRARPSRARRRRMAYPGIRYK